MEHHYSLISGFYTFLVNVSYAKVVMVSPVTIKVSESAKLVLGIGKGESNNEYVVNGMFLSVLGIPDKQIKIFVNDNLAGTATTYGIFGRFNMTLKMPPVDNKPTLYDVRAVFEGDNPRNVTSYLYTPNGTQYAVCTTLQYFGYKPASNCTWLTVEPQSIQVMQQRKTPEQLQEEETLIH